MDLAIWIIDKVFILIIMWIGMKVFDRKVRTLINDVIAWWMNPKSKKPTWKDAVGLVAMDVAREVGPELGKAAKDGVRNMFRGGPIGKS